MHFQNGIFMKKTSGICGITFTCMPHQFLLNVLCTMYAVQCRYYGMVQRVQIRRKQVSFPDTPIVLDSLPPLLFKTTPAPLSLSIFKATSKHFRTCSRICRGTYPPTVSVFLHDCFCTPSLVVHVLMTEILALSVRVLRVVGRCSNQGQMTSGANFLSLRRALLEVWIHGKEHQRFLHLLVRFAILVLSVHFSGCKLQKIMHK